MGPLLTPSDTILLVLANAETASLGSTAPLARQIDVIIQAAGMCAVPIFEIQFPYVQTSVVGAGDRLTSEHAIYSLDLNPDDWSATPLGINVANANRTSLLVVGYWLEEAVTFVVLQALSHSYRVYVILDATPAESNAAADAAQQRLIFAGAIPTTTHQVLGEWAATTSDSARRQALLALRPN